MKGNASSTILYFLSIVAVLLTSPGTMAADNGKPDLVITNFWIWPKTPTSREWFDIRVRVRNASETALTGQTTVNIFVGGSSKPYTMSLGSLGANKDRDFEQRIFLASNVLNNRNGDLCSFSIDHPNTQTEGISNSPD